MNDKSELSQLSLAGAAYRCEQETALFLKKKPCDPCYCYELFCRAIRDGDQHAWEAVVRIYTPLVVSWVKHHTCFPDTREEAGFIANGAFMRMTVYMTPAKFSRSRDLAALLKYLKLCVHSEIMQYRESVEMTDLEDEQVAAAPPEAAIDLEAFWNRVYARLRNDQERQVLAALFRLGLKPGQVPAAFPELRLDVGQVYRIYENVLGRLKRDREIRHWVSEYLMPEK
jgi:hypothetical protein